MFLYRDSYSCMRHENSMSIKEPRSLKKKIYDEQALIPVHFLQSIPSKAIRPQVKVWTCTKLNAQCENTLLGDPSRAPKFYYGVTSNIRFDSMN